MFIIFLSTAALTILVLGQGAMSAPQTNSCGLPYDPPCMTHFYQVRSPAHQHCCANLPTNPPTPGGFCAPGPSPGPCPL
ncbi:hypothetical protein DFH09DRAFT_1363667, partial [Mycena vulgaris]